MCVCGPIYAQNVSDTFPKNSINIPNHPSYRVHPIPSTMTILFGSLQIMKILHMKFTDLQLEMTVRQTLGQLDPFCLSTMTFLSEQDHERLDFDEEDSGVNCPNNMILDKFDRFFPDTTMFRVVSHKGGLDVHVMLSENGLNSRVERYSLVYKVSVENFTGDRTVGIIIALIRKYGCVTGPSGTTGST